MLLRYIDLRFLVIFLVFAPSFLCANGTDKDHEKQLTDSIICLKNNSSSLSVDLFGGAIVGFRLDSTTINPFSWKEQREQMPENNKSGAIFQGHFLCLGRWGAPTKGEMMAGVPHNGQSCRDMWRVDSISNLFILMNSEAPLDGIIISRAVKIARKSPVFKVEEKIKNINTVGRLFNMVQHATLGSPFLDSTTIVDTNAKEGFMQSMSYPNPSAFEYTWPIGFIDSSKNTLDLTRSSMHYSYVTTHIFSDSIGWVIASSPKRGLLVGYIWKTREYPWINIWNQLVDGKLWAKGLEFGTTGIGRSYPELLEKDTRFHGRNSFFFLDAKETVEKSYICFEIKIPVNFNGVSEVILDKNKICIYEKKRIGNNKFSIPIQFD